MTQYATGGNLNARIELHRRFSTGPRWFDWLADHLKGAQRLLDVGCGTAALWRDRPQSRLLISLLLGELVLGDLYALVLAQRWLGSATAGDAVSGVVFVILMAGLGYWYLFRKKTTAEYYASLQTT